MQKGFDPLKFGYGIDMKAEDQFFGKEVALAATVSFAKVLATGRTQSGLAVVLEAVEEVEIEATKKITLTPSYADVETGPFTDDKRSYTITFAQATTFKPGQRIATFNIGDIAGTFTKIKLATDSAKTTKVNCYLEYVPR